MAVQVVVVVVFLVAIVMKQCRHPGAGGESLDPDAATVVVAAPDIVVAHCH